MTDIFVLSPAAHIGAAVFSLIAAYLYGATLWKAPAIALSAIVGSQVATFAIERITGHAGWLAVADVILLGVIAFAAAQVLRVPLRATGAIMIGACAGALTFGTLALFMPTA